MDGLPDQNLPIKRYLDGLAPISNVHAQTLILGSFPGVASLKAQQYYRHPRNGFWPICAEALNFLLDAHYEDQCEQLVQNKIAVWDVLSSCKRQGSLDSAIETATIRCNDFARFFQTHPKIQRVLFNGGVARRFFDRFSLPNLPKSLALQLLTMPSTSPAFAAMRIEQKRAVWHFALRNIT